MAKCSALKNIYKAKWCDAHHLKFMCKYYMLKNQFLFNCHIHYKAQIPESTGLSHHGMGVVINKATVIGENVIIAHGVTIGNRMPTDGRSPRIGNNVYIGSGAYIGGGVTIGDNAKIGANAVVIKDVPANATCVGNPGRILPIK